MDIYRAMVSLRLNTQAGGKHMQWVTERAENVIEARLAIEAKYGKIVQGPIREIEGPPGGSYYDTW